jgi:hypothetical protein
MDKFVAIDDFLRVVVLAAAITLGTGCANTALAPGAAKVKITRSADDVASCKPVGNIHLDCDNTINVGTEPIVRNQVIGLGGNTVFVTAGTLGAICSGVAYSCP